MSIKDNSQRVTIEVTRGEAHTIWDALHTFYEDQRAKGILLSTEAAHIRRIIDLMHGFAFPVNKGRRGI